MSMNNDAYAAAFAELEEGRVDKGAWARAFAESGGDESKAKAQYIKARVELKNDSPDWSNTQPPVEDVPKKRTDPKTNDGQHLHTNQPVEHYGAALGHKNSDYYVGKFLAFDEKGPGLHASWNWAAFFFTGFWALYRKMYGWFFVWWVLGTVGTTLLKVPNPQIQRGVGIAYIACCLGFAIFGNALYHRKINARIKASRKSNSDASRVSKGLNKGSGVHTWVAIVFGAIPVLGILAAVALPAYKDYSKPHAVAAASTSEIDDFLDGKRVTTPPAPTSDRPVGWDKGVIAPLENGSAQDLYVQKVRKIQAQVNRGEFSLVDGTTSLEPPKNLAQWPNADSLKLEQSQTWWRNESNQFKIHIQNTTPYDLTALALDFGQQGCDSAVTKRRFYVAIRQIIPPGSQSLVSFTPPISISETPKNCLVVFSAW